VNPRIPRPVVRLCLIAGLGGVLHAALEAQDRLKSMPGYARYEKMSREIPPCMAMGEAAGVAAVLALDAGVSVRNVDVGAVQRVLRSQGADPGDQSGANPDVPVLARAEAEAGVAA